MTISILQHATVTVPVTSGTTATASPAFTSETTEGNCLVALISTAVDSGTPSVTGVTTNGSAENWASAESETETTIAHQLTAAWVNPGTAGGQTVIDVALSYTSSLSGNTTEILVTILEIQALGSSSVVDQVGAGSGSASSWSSGTTGETAQAAEILIGVVSAVANGETAPSITGPSSPWTNYTALTGGFDSSEQSIAQLVGYQVVSAEGTATYSGTFATTTPYAAVVITLKGVTNTGTATVAVPKPALAGTGAYGPSGAGTVAVPKPALAGAGTFDNTREATVAVAVPKPSLAGLVAVQVTGAAAVAVPKPGLAGLGWLTVTGAGHVAVPKPGLSGAGRSGSVPPPSAFLAFFP